MLFFAKNYKKSCFIAFLDYSFSKIQHHFHFLGWNNVKGFLKLTPHYAHFYRNYAQISNYAKHYAGYFHRNLNYAHFNHVMLYEINYALALCFMLQASDYAQNG